MRKGTSQAVKDVQQTLAERKAPCATQHVYEHRPWGTFEVLRDTAQFKSKVIRVEPGQQLSYQSHAKRAEHWIVVSGQAEVVLNDVVHRLIAGQHIHIPQGAKHRMRNPGKDVVEFVEVQLGSYFGEDDIVRYQDDYQRT
jgi:mannose-1-phosphate guanylyltransferase/mannose-1-phosphate guanylyltransferase/mannose-6-phosphate isomerase